MKHKHIWGLLQAASILALLGLAGCKAAPAQSSGFADGQTLENDPTLPFHRVWRKEGFDPQRYKTLYVAEVDTAYMLKVTTWDKGTRRQEFEKDVEELGVYTREALKKAFREDPEHRFVVVDARPSEPDAVVLEMALTEIVPSKVLLNTLGFAPFFIGTTIKTVRMAADDRSSVAMEARLEDAKTGETVMIVADREAEQSALLNVKKFTWYSEARSLIDTWAKQFVKAANRKQGEEVEDTKPFTLKPW